MFSHKHLNLQTQIIEALHVHYIVRCKDDLILIEFFFSILDMCKIRTLEYLPGSHMEFQFPTQLPLSYAADLVDSCKEYIK